MKLHVLQIAAYLVIIAAGMKAAAPVLNVVFLALLIGVSILPLIIWLMKKGVPKSVSLLITIFTLILILVIISSVLSVAIVGLADKIPQYEEQLISIKDGTAKFLSGIGIDVSNIIIEILALTLVFGFLFLMIFALIPPVWEHMFIENEYKKKILFSFVAIVLGIVITLLYL